MTNADKRPYRSLVHTPAELASQYVRWAESLQGAPGIRFGISSVDRVVIPFHPGDMVVFCARPGHCKTATLAYLARLEAWRIQQRGKAEVEAVVYVTWEQVAEELESLFEINEKYTASDLAWGRANIDDVRSQSTKRAAVPIWMIGESLARSTTKTPRMTTDAVFQAIGTMEEDFGVKPVLLLLDYIQLIPVRRAVERVTQVTEAAIRVKELAKRVGCPVVVGVQARQEVDDRQWKIPGLRDAQWASSIGQTADKFFSLWRPCLTEERNIHGEFAPVMIDGRPHTVTKNLLVMRMLKQRFDEGRWTWPLHFKPEYLELAEIERDVTEPNW